MKSKTTTIPKIQVTTDYDLFQRNAIQREYKPAHAADLAQRMKRFGFTPSCAISVFRNRKGQLVMNNGHHRHSAAKMAGVPVFYVIEHEWSPEEILAEAISPKGWPLMDVARAAAGQGNKHYITLLKYVQRGIPIKIASSLLGEEFGCAGNQQRLVKDQAFEVKSEVLIRQLVEIMDRLEPVAPVVMTANFMSAWSALTLVPGFETERLVHKIAAFPAMLGKCVTRDQQLDQLEAIYNFKTPAANKLPLAFQAAEILKRRKATFGRDNSLPA
jgi:hypothetical protein